MHFGILANRFRVFGKPISIDLDKVPTLILATCALHNYLRSGVSEKEDVARGYILNPADQTTNSREFLSLYPTHTRSPTAAIRMRENFCEYLNNSGALSYQNICTIQTQCLILVPTCSFKSILFNKGAPGFLSQVFVVIFFVSNNPQMRGFFIIVQQTNFTIVCPGCHSF